ncbi:hypothetical protein Syun_014730 [Stephania yunnanensis]|uniref:Uncharacterized protein n=1 Tax=Stephania yunnanensis TaxID=152371 RepID=A0AAP0PC46_9MAGN
MVFPQAYKRALVPSNNMSKSSKAYESDRSWCGFRRLKTSAGNFLFDLFLMLKECLLVVSEPTKSLEFSMTIDFYLCISMLCS